MVFNNECDLLPDDLKTLLMEKGYNPETGIIGNMSPDNIVGTPKMAYTRALKYFGKSIGKVIIIGFDHDYLMLDKAVSKEMLEYHGIDEIRNVYTETLGNILAYCTNCGRLYYPRPATVYNGTITSCGCIRGRKVPTRIPDYLYIKDKESYTRLYRIFISMIHRCYHATPGTYEYKVYRGKGIRIDKCWYSKKSDEPIVEQFSKPGGFKEWALAHGYEDPEPGTDPMDALSIDRIDGSKNYAPDNCRWIPKWMQSENLRYTEQFDTVDLDGNPVKGSIYELARQYNRDPDLIVKRCNDRRLKKRAGRNDMIWGDYDILTIPNRLTIGNYYDNILTAPERTAEQHRLEELTGKDRVQGMMPKDSVDYRRLYDGPRYNDKGELRDKDGFLILDWKIDIRKRYQIEHDIWVRNKKEKKRTKRREKWKKYR